MIYIYIYIIYTVGSPFTVGKLPHCIRIKLMKQHIQADDNFGRYDINIYYISVLINIIYI